MKLRICIILLLGALTLACFEIWRYRTENKNFKYLYDAQSVERKAYWLAFRAYNYTIILLQDSGLLKDKLKFSRHSVYSYISTNHDASSASVAANCQLEFSYEYPLQLNDLKQIDQAVETLKEYLPPKSEAVWRLENNTLYIFIKTERKMFFEPWTRFSKINNKA